MPIDRKSVMERADRLVSEGKLEPALAEYGRLLRDDPGDAALRNRFGDLCLQAGNKVDAAGAFKVLALQLQREHQEKKAIAMLRKVQRFAPDDLEAAHQLVEMLHASGASKEAAAVHFDLAARHEGRGNLELALEERRQGVAADPANLEQRHLLAKKYQEAGHEEKSVALLLETAEGLALAGKVEEARSLAGEADPAVAGPRIHLALARIEVLACHLDRAEAHLWEALVAYPGNPVVLETLAGVEIQAGRPAEGLARIREVRNPSGRLLPICESAMRDLAEAGKGRLALRLFRPLARELASRGHGSAVAASLKSAFRGRPSAALWMALADVHQLADQNSEAIDALRQAYVLSADRPSRVLTHAIHRRIKELDGRERTRHQILNEQAQMVTMAIPVLSHERLNPQAKLQIERMEQDARGQARLGNVQGALSMLQEVLKLEPTRFSTVQSLVDLYIGAGQVPKAQKQCIDSAQLFHLHGRKQEARLLLDLAEKQVPGSSNGPRRMLGL